jgi:hypothetical protein
VLNYTTVISCWPDRQAMSRWDVLLTKPHFG